MKLSIVIPVLNQFSLFKVAYEKLREVTETISHEVEFIIIDNGSTEPLEEVLGASVVRNEESIGVYPTFKQGMEHATGDIVAFFHSDVIIHETNWNLRVIEEFMKNPRLGCIGFVGSDEIDWHGGRGGGTASNFQGLSVSEKNTIPKEQLMNPGYVVPTLKMWTGSPAHAHGRTITDLMNAAVVDGCVMILRREAWNQIGYREGFPIHHFYDRLICTQMLEANWQVAVLGIAFDHISGQTVGHEVAYDIAVKKYCDEQGIPFDGIGWDSTIYREAEKRWLREYRDEKHFIPIKVAPTV